MKKENRFKKWLLKTYGENFKDSMNYHTCSNLTRKGWLACKKNVLEILADSNDSADIVRRIKEL